MLRSDRIPSDREIKHLIAAIQARRQQHRRASVPGKGPYEGKLFRIWLNPLHGRRVSVASVRPRMPVEGPIVEPPPLDRNQQRNQQRDGSPVGPIVILPPTLFFLDEPSQRFGEGSSKNKCSNETGTRLHLGSKIAEIEPMTRGRIPTVRRNAPP